MLRLLDCQAVDAGLVTAAEFQESAGPFLDGYDAARGKTVFEDSMASHEAGPGEVHPDAITDYASTATASPEDKAMWNKTAMDAYAAGKVGLMVLAGGQGTRLGFDKPKGQFILDLPGKKSIFQLMCERILKLKELAGGKVTTTLTTH